MRVTFDQCNDTDEVCGLFNKIFDNQSQMEAKIIQNAQAIEALKPKKKGKKEMKSKGSASMRVLAIMMLVVAITGLCYAAYVPTDITSEICANHDTLSVFLRDVLGTMASDSYLFNPRTPAPLAVTGRVYYESTTDTWIGYNGTAWQTFDVAGGVGLNGAYDFGGAGTGRTILANDGAVVISNAEGDTANLLELTYTGSAGAIGLLVTIDGTEPAIEIENTSTGYDIEGTGATWYTTSAGIIVGVSGDLTGAAGLTLQNDETITNPNGSITFTDTGGNTLIFDMDDGATSILIDSGDVVTLDWGTVDRFISMETITFDDAATAAITMTGTGTNNLTISQTGVGDESLVLTSAGGALDAITISGTGATSGIDIDALNDINIQVTSSTDAEDILITQSGVHNASIILTADGTGTDAIKLETTNAGGDIWIDSGDDFDIDVAGILDIDIVGAITLDSAAGIDILSAEAADGAITIATSNAAGQVVITSTDTTADALDINTTGGVDVDTIDGGIALTTAGAVNGDILLDASDKITVVSSDAQAAGILLQVDGGAAETIHINSTAGTSAAAINIDADVGGITLLADGAAAGDILIDAEDKITITSADQDADGIDIGVPAGGHAVSTIHVHNETGTAVDSIEILSDAGGVTITSNVASADGINLNAITGGVDIDSALQLNLEGTQAAATAIVINASNASGGISLQTGVATGILINTATFEHKVKYFPISAGVTSATEVIVGGGTGLTCVGLAAGVDEIGSTEGYASVDTETDYVRFSIPLPDDFVDTGTAEDLIINFDLHETGASVEINIVAQIYEYDGTANVVAVVDDTLIIDSDAARTMETFEVLTTGIGAVANLHQGDHLIFVLSSVAGEDDFNIYGVEMIYRCGLAATQ